MDNLRTTQSTSLSTSLQQALRHQWQRCYYAFCLVVEKAAKTLYRAIVPIQKMEEQKVQLQILNIQLQTLAQLECVKKFLELNEKAEMLASLIKKEEAPSE